MSVAMPLPSSLLSSLNECTADAFTQRLGGAVEHAPWVAQQAWQSRPFDSLDALAAAMARAIRGAPKAAQLELLNGHPELAGREAQAGAMTDESTTEQGRLGLLRLSSERLARLGELNRAYRARFGFPLIIALALHDHLDSVFEEAERRLRHSVETEWNTALDQVCAVMRGRLQRMAAAGPTPPLPAPTHAPTSTAPRKDLP